MHIHVKLVHFICVERDKLLEGWVVFENGDIDLRHAGQVRALNARFPRRHRFREHMVVVAERLDFRPGVFALMVPEFRDVGFVEMAGHVVEKRGGASAFARWKDYLHEGLANG